MAVRRAHAVSQQRTGTAFVSRVAANVAAVALIFAAAPPRVSAQAPDPPASSARQATGAEPGPAEIRYKGVTFVSPLNDNSACSVEFPAAGTACQAQAKDLAQIQAGFWYRFHKGPEGTLQAGVSYSGTRKDTWPGAGGVSPQGRNHILMASFRYFIP